MTTQPLESKRDSFLLQLTPVMFCFFAMGFVDLVGTGSNYVQKDLNLSDAEANLFPSLVFFWFLIFSVPTGMLMNRIGRKNTVLLSLAVTALSLFIPMFGSSYAFMLVSFSLLGIGNAIMQTSLNPLVTNLITGDKLASTLTFGQFIKAISSFLAPIIAAWGATTAMNTFGLGWKLLFVIYGAVGILSILLLAATSIDEEKPEAASGIMECFKLLGHPFILLCFVAIMCHVGIDVGTNTCAPKMLMERLNLPLEEAGYATSIYFICRTVGCFLGALLLRSMSDKTFLIISILLIIAGLGTMAMGHSLEMLYVGVGLIGFGNANAFSVVFTQALNHLPSKKNEVSGLMIMGLFGGTVFPFAMGYASDAIGQIGSIAIMSVGAVYVLYYALSLKTSK